MTRRDFLCRAGATAALAGPAAGAAADTAAGEAPARTGSAAAAAKDAGWTSEEFTVRVGPRPLLARLLSPAKDRLAANPLLLLTLAGDRQTALTVPPACLGASAFLARGHRALSFDLPDHGQRADRYGKGIQAWRNAWVAGEDRFAHFVEEAGAVIGRCIETGRVAPGRVVAYGISRGGYLALRLLAADSRVAAAAAIGPVTDWRELAEFAAERGRTDVGDLRLSRWVEGLAGKRVFIVIGNADARVSTVSCCRFLLDLAEANARRGRADLPLEFHCAEMAESGHVVDDAWRVRGADFLLRAAL
jgi:hypothetical protein